MGKSCHNNELNAILAIHEKTALMKKNKLLLSIKKTLKLIGLSDFK
jgi:hypothetical protein